MHSRILQLEKKPDFEAATEEALIESGITESIADYVVELRGSEAREDALEWFTGYFGGMTFGKDEEGRDVIRIASRLDTLAGHFNQFKEEVANVTLDKFCDFGWAIRMSEILGDSNGFYVYSNGYGYDRATTFFRRLTGTDIVLYVGTIFDYHF